MKKMMCGLLMLVFFSSIVSAQDFNVKWLDGMVAYIGKSKRNIPDDFKQKQFDKTKFEKGSSSDIIEQIQLDDTNIINQIIWHRAYDSRSKMYTDFDIIFVSISKKLGKPFMSDEDNAAWAWNKFCVIFGIGSGDSLEVGILTPAAMGLSQEQFDKKIKELSQQ